MFDYFFQKNKTHLIKKTQVHTHAHTNTHTKQKEKYILQRSENQDNSKGTQIKSSEERISTSVSAHYNCSQILHE